MTTEQKYHRVGNTFAAVDLPWEQFDWICERGLRPWFDLPKNVECIWIVLSDSRTAQAYRVRVPKNSLHIMHITKGDGRTSHIHCYTGFARRIGPKPQWLSVEYQP